MATAGVDGAMELLLNDAMGELGDPEQVPQSEDSPPATPQTTPTERAPDQATPTATGDGPTVSSTATTTEPPAGTPDPLDGTEPFKYTFGDESKTLDGFYRVPNEGVLVPEDKVPLLEQLAVRAEMADRASRDASSTTALYERLSEWTTVGSDGTEKTLTGIEGILQSRLDYARLDAYQKVSESYFSDPNRLASLLQFNPETQKFEFSPDGMERAREKLQLEQTKADVAARGSLAQRYQEPPKVEQPNYTAAAPQVIQSMAQSAKLDPGVLTADDKAYLANQLPRYVRPATADDVRFDPKLRVGQSVVDAAYRDVVTRTIAMRKEAVTQATASTTAQKFNAGQDKGRQKPAMAKPPVSPPAPSRSPTPKPKADWDGPLDAALSELGIS